MARPGPRSVRTYSDEFKLTAVRLSQRPGIQVRTVATSLAIHPVLLSRWRTDARDGRLTGRAPDLSIILVSHTPDATWEEAFPEPPEL